MLKLLWRSALALSLGSAAFVAPGAAGESAVPTPAALEGGTSCLDVAPVRWEVAAPVEAAGEIGAMATCTATADCGAYPDVHCELQGSGTCEAVDRNCCYGQRGYVRCGSSTTYCPSCSCSGCSCGSTTWEQTSSCCYGLHLWKQKRCCESGWTYTGLTDCLVECGGGGPL